MSSPLLARATQFASTITVHGAQGHYLSYVPILTWGGAAAWPRHCIAQRLVEVTHPLKMSMLKHRHDTGYWESLAEAKHLDALLHNTLVDYDVLGNVPSLPVPDPEEGQKT